MQDSDPQLPPTRPARSSRANPATRATYQNEASLPAGRTARAILYGIAAGIVTAGIGLLVIFINASLYSHPPAAASPSSALQNYAFTLVGLSCLTFFLSQLIYFLAGFLCGKTLIERRQGFLAGFIGGALSYVISFFANYIPGFPGKSNATGTINGQAVAGGLVIALIFLLVNGGIGGLFGVFGARIATRRHPYYTPDDDDYEDDELVTE